MKKKFLYILITILIISYLPLCAQVSKTIAVEQAGTLKTLLTPEELKSVTSGAVVLQQFLNPSNPKMHRETTAKEIWNDTYGKVDVWPSSFD